MTLKNPPSPEKSAASVDTLIDHLRSLNVTDLGVTSVGDVYLSAEAINHAFESIYPSSLAYPQVLTSCSSRAGLSKTSKGVWESGDGGIYCADVV